MERKALKIEASTLCTFFCATALIIQRAVNAVQRTFSSYKYPSLVVYTCVCIIACLLLKHLCTSTSSHCLKKEICNKDESVDLHIFVCALESLSVAACAL